MTDFARTIAAIATPPGKGGVAVIRISGADAFRVADKCFLPAYGEEPLSKRPPRSAVRGDILMDGEKIDDGLAFCFPAPHSYTGENTVEISCHGGLLITRTVLEAVLAAGASLAEAGEFTRRAYLNGALTLTEAEAIGNLLEATNLSQIRLASRESRNRLSRTLAELHDELVLLVSTLYANIDYPEEDLADLTNEELTARLSALSERMEALRKTYRTGRTIAAGVSTVICGRPNVGKSSLYNLLCCEDVAIVTEIAGTTRDLLERTVSLGDIPLRLCDTAGLRDTDDRVEQIGVERTRARIEESELVLAVFDSSVPLTDEDRRLIASLRGASAAVIAVLNKTDLVQADMAEVYAAFPHVVSLSAKEGNSGALAETVADLFTDGNIRVGQDAILFGVRQYTAFSRALELVNSTLSALRQGIPADIAASELELALGALSESDGRAVSEEIVDSIFSHFCIGK